MKISMDGVSVYIGMPIYGQIVAQTAMSLVSTVHHCGINKFPVEVGMHQRGIVSWARDQVIDGFLQTKHTKLFWIDSDIIWTIDDFFKLVAFSTMRDVVCGSYRAKRDSDVDFQIRASVTAAQEPDDLGLVSIAGCGLGFTIMDRSVIEALAATKPMVREGDRMTPKVFETDRLLDNMRMGEDFAFFQDIIDLGFGISLDPHINLGHAGQKIWTGKAMDSFEHA